MKLFIKCANCKSIISFRTWCVDRVSLKMSKGDKIDLICKQCNKSNTYDVDDFKARAVIAAPTAPIAAIAGNATAFIFEKPALTLFRPFDTPSFSFKINVAEAL